MLNKIRSSSVASSYVARSELCVALDAAPSTLALTNECLLAVGGRKIFRILKLCPDRIETVVNLRDLPYKKTVNLNYSTSDIQWRPGSDYHLATAPPNGSIVLWDLTISKKDKIEHVFDHNHERAVNKLCFHGHDHNLLLSGSQDSTMKLFDTRSKMECVKFKGRDAVRDVKFSPYKEHVFAAVSDDGTIEMWDKRYSESHMVVYSAHFGPVYCCAWHPERDNQILTGGRDKNLKIFDVQMSSIKEVDTLPTILPVSCVQWRPGHKTQLGSSAQLLDSNVMVWDCNRPYVPLYSFDKHSDDITDFLWLSESEIVSCAKDNKIHVQSVKHATSPHKDLSPVALALTHEDDVLFGCRNSSHQFTRTASARGPTSFRREQEASSFTVVTSSLFHFNTFSEKDNSFVKCAQLYQLTGDRNSNCLTNAKICETLQLKEKANTWNILRLICSHGNQSFLSNQAPNSGRVSVARSRRSSVHSSHEPHHPPTKGGTAQGRGTEVDSPVVGIEEDTESIDSFKVDMMEFYEEQEDELSDIAVATNLMPSDQEWELRAADALVMKKDIAPVLLERPRSPDGRSSVSATQSEITHGTVTRTTSAQMIGQNWSFLSCLVDMLKSYAWNGDVQMAVSVMSVLGDLLKDLLDLNQNKLTLREVRQWYNSYCEQLTRKHLWSVVATVTNSCPLSEVQEQLKVGLPIGLGCGNCKRPLPKARWQCSNVKCSQMCTKCSICHQTVRGLFTYCSECGHGGHASHLQTWFSEHKQCPTGCGHNCIITV